MAEPRVQAFGRGYDATGALESVTVINVQPVRSPTAGVVFPQIRHRPIPRPRGTPAPFVMCVSGGLQKGEESLPWSCWESQDPMHQVPKSVRRVGAKISSGTQAQGKPVTLGPAARAPCANHTLTSMAPKEVTGVKPLVES